MGKLIPLLYFRHSGTISLDMLYKILADLLVVIHFIWILFMLWGFILTLSGSFTLYFLHTAAERRPSFFDRWLFRTIHLSGILYVAVLTIFGKYCPLTIWENQLRARHAPHLKYPASFVIHYIEKLVYPDADFLLFVIPTMIIALFTLIMFVLKPPAKIKQLTRYLFKI